MEHEAWASSSSLAPTAYALPPSAADADAVNWQKHRKRSLSKNESRRCLSSERLPNPFVGPIHWSSSPAAANNTREYRDRPGRLYSAMHSGSGAAVPASEFAGSSAATGMDGGRAHGPAHRRTGSGSFGAQGVDASNAHGSYGSDGSSDSSSGGVGLATIYSPEQVREPCICGSAHAPLDAYPSSDSLCCLCCFPPSRRARSCARII